jgi:outer membrane protein assembly factor BamE (lipoprotein component of BamABCDE complex)
MIRKIFLFDIFLSIVFVCLIGCETLTPRQEFRQLRLGMEKGEVTDIVGSPIREERRADKDWWYYQFKEGGRKFERMVVFAEGRVVYAGRVTLPKYIKEAEKIDKDHDIGDMGLRGEMAPLLNEDGTPARSGP